MPPVSENPEETRSLPGRVLTMRRLSPVGAVWRGVLAGAVGTIAMDLLWFYRYKRGGGESGFLDWELSTEASSWEAAPAPAQIGRRLLEAVFHRQVPVEQVALVNDVEEAQLSARSWNVWYSWGMMIGFLFLAIASLCYLTPTQTPSRRVVGSIVIAMFLPLIDLMNRVGDTSGGKDKGD